MGWILTLFLLSGFVANAFFVRSSVKQMLYVPQACGHLPSLFVILFVCLCWACKESQTGSYSQNDAGTKPIAASMHINVLNSVSASENHHRKSICGAVHECVDVHA